MCVQVAILPKTSLKWLEKHEFVAGILKKHEDEGNISFSGYLLLAQYLSQLLTNTTSHDPRKVKQILINFADGELNLQKTIQQLVQKHEHIRKAFESFKQAMHHGIETRKEKIHLQIIFEQLILATHAQLL